MAKFVPVDPFDLVIFGGTGDLSRRKLLPALFHRWLDGQIPSNSRIIGSARTNMDDNGYRDFARAACKAATREDWDETVWQDFANILFYYPMDATSADADWTSLRTKLDPVEGRPCIFYLATSPRLYVQIAEALGQNGLSSDPVRLVLEKPIGTDLNSAREINEGVAAVFAENQVYRIDHYLGKETVQNLMVLRFANTLFEPLWNRNAIDHVQITVAENLGLEGRADYYDKSGALRDMVQNHILQLLCLTAMEPPGSTSGDDIRTEKIKVLRALAPIDEKEVLQNTVRAQYTSGLVEGEVVQSYQDTLSADEASETETYVAVKTFVNNWRWAGIPFYLRTGKRMAKSHSDIVIQFKEAPHSLFGDTPVPANRLVMRLQPDEGVQLYVQIKEPGPGGLRIKSLPLNLSYAENFTLRYPDAYERLLMDVVRGNLSLFMRADEVEAAWAWVDQLIEAWNTSSAPLDSYAAGSEGPTSSSVLMDRDGRKWWQG
ncbi:MAG: glucose-6-phosphate dehydrogenase [Hyphomonadaceae bacterium]|nr:glucose-6-phosphate dehydrogenase [Hyphomonadaceae bacterium]OUX93069.1 MAG: glucose-6-phosphate dehydrogenase [Hyphomonas sp. TMED17]